MSVAAVQIHCIHRDLHLVMEVRVRQISGSNGNERNYIQTTTVSSSRVYEPVMVCKNKYLVVG